jgi:hypothetical protein
LAKNLERCKKVGIANGLKLLDLAVMEELVEGVQRKQVEQKPSSDPQSKDDAVKVEVESADESEGHLPEKRPAKKQRRACHGSKSAVKIESRIDFTVSAACHVCRLMASLFMSMLFKLSKDFLNDDALILKVIGDFEAASGFWAANAKEEKTAGQQTADEHKSLVDSIVIILQSCLKEESKKPAASRARTARRTVLDASRSKEVFVVDLAKAFLAYDAPKASMEVVKAFTSRCMEDENASAMYDAALAEFEGHFDDVFEDSTDGYLAAQIAPCCRWIRCALL